jgi:hypothetical protein
VIEAIDPGTAAIVLSVVLGLLSTFLALRYRQFKIVLRNLAEFLLEASLTLEDDQVTAEELSRCAAKAQELRKSVLALVSP